MTKPVFIHGWHGTYIDRAQPIVREGLRPGCWDGILGEAVYISLDKRTNEFYHRPVLIEVEVELPSPDAIRWVRAEGDWPWGVVPDPCKPAAGMLDGTPAFGYGCPSSNGGNQLAIYDTEAVKIHLGPVTICPGYDGITGFGNAKESVDYTLADR